MFRIIVLAAVLTALTAEPVRFRLARKADGRIIGGKDTTIEEVPYQVSLQIYGSHNCGGSIISDTWVVTAGHCVDKDPKPYTIRAGSSVHHAGGSVHQVVKVVKHEGFSIDRYGHPINDIALLHVEQPFDFDETRRAVELFEIGEESVAGAVSLITGWGNTLQGFPEVLQIVQVPIISKKACYDDYADKGGIPDNEICAAYPEGGKDACQGDSGGPLAINGRLAGIVSWGHGCARPGSPGVYTEIASYRAWIKEQSGV